jgi:NAD(P)-dependent dehydrogenase (short-subunit alcohol dehydrogenase family)
MLPVTVLLQTRFLPRLTNIVAIAPQAEEQERSPWDQQAITRLGEPEDITGAILFLTSDDAAFISGPGHCRRRRSVPDRLRERMLLDHGSDITVL